MNYLLIAHISSRFWKTYKIKICIDRGEYMYAQRYLEGIIPIRVSRICFALMSVRWHVARVDEKHARNPKTSLIARGSAWVECKTRRSRTRDAVSSKSHVKPHHAGVQMSYTCRRDFSTSILVPLAYYSQFAFCKGVINSRQTTRPFFGKTWREYRFEIKSNIIVFWNGSLD